MERLKDILYDISDSLIIVIIFALMIFIVSTKINHSLPIENTLLSDSGIENDISPDVINENNTTKDGQDIEIQTAIKPTINNNKNQEEQETTATTENEITVVIPSGASSQKIANILYENGLIASESEFIKLVENSNISGMLKAGTYHFDKNPSIEDVIDMLTN